MNEKDYSFVSKATTAMVNKGIDEVSESGRQQHIFQISDAHIKTATNRSRLHPEIREQIIQEFSNQGMNAVYDSKAKVTKISFDIGAVSLNPAQAQDLVVARNLFRANS